MASQQEIQQIITNFLLNAPPGEFMEVVTDIRGLLKNDAILNSLAPSVFKQYNTDQMLKVKTPYNSEFLITKQGEVSANEYLDPATKQIVTFDHIRQEITGARSAGNALDSDVEPYRKAFETQVTEYVKEHFENGLVSCTVLRTTTVPTPSLLASPLSCSTPTTSTLADGALSGLALSSPDQAMLNSRATFASPCTTTKTVTCS